MALKKQQTQTDVPIVPPGTKPVYEKQTNKKRKTITHNVHISHVGSPFWQPRAFNGVSLCSCQLPCSSGALTHCGSLSLIRSMLSFPAMQQPVKHITGTATPWENPNSLCTNTGVLSLIAGCPQSSNHPGIKERKQRTERPAGKFPLYG